MRSLRIRIERVLLAPAMAHGLVLDPAADLVEHPVGDPGHMERIGHSLGMGEVGEQPGPVGVGQIEGDDLHAPAPALRPPGRPSAQLGGTFPLEQVDHLPPVEVDQGGGVDGRVLRRGGQVAVLVDAQGPDRADPVRGRPRAGCRGARRPTRRCPSPLRTRPATEATERHSWPTWRVTSAPARSVRTWRAAMPSIFSVQVFLTQPVVRHRHRRLLMTTSRQGRPQSAGPAGGPRRGPGPGPAGGTTDRSPWPASTRP